MYKFRGRRLCSDEYVYGDLSYDKHARPYIGFKKDGKYTRVLVEDVGQYLGFTDKNGKEVYEGDSVKFEHKHRMYDAPSEVLMGYMQRDMEGTYVAVPAGVSSFAYYLSADYNMCWQYNDDIPSTKKIEVL